MENTYKYSIRSLKLKSEAHFRPGRINLLVGANNCGKTQLLKDMLSYISGEKKENLIPDKLRL